MYGVRDAVSSVRLETAPTMTQNVVAVEFLGKRGVDRFRGVGIHWS